LMERLELVPISLFVYFLGRLRAEFDGAYSDAGFLNFI